MLHTLWLNTSHDFSLLTCCLTELWMQMTVRKRYEAMRDALNATGKPILFSMCEWGVSSPWEYGHQVPVLPRLPIK